MTTRIRETERNEQLNLETEIYDPLSATFERIKKEIKKDDNINVKNFRAIENAVKSVKSRRKRWAKGKGIKINEEDENGVPVEIPNLNFIPGTLVLYYKPQNTFLFLLSEPYPVYYLAWNGTNMPSGAMYRDGHYWGGASNARHPGHRMGEWAEDDYEEPIKPWIEDAKCYLKYTWVDEIQWWRDVEWFAVER